MHYFHFFKGRSGSFSSFGLCFEGEDQKNRQREKILATPMNFPTPGKNSAGTHGLKMNSAVPQAFNIYSIYY